MLRTRMHFFVFANLDFLACPILIESSFAFTSTAFIFPAIVAFSVQLSSKRFEYFLCDLNFAKFYLMDPTNEQ